MFWVDGEEKVTFGNAKPRPKWARFLVFVFVAWSVAAFRCVHKRIKIVATDQVIR